MRETLEVFDLGEVAFTDARRVILCIAPHRAVFFTDAELDATRAWLEDRRDGFVEALEQADHAKLPLSRLAALAAHS
jgi:hypothetical protein